MAYSNTVSQTVFDTRRVIDNAVRRCKLQAAQITSEYIDIANDQLYLLLGNLANQGVPLWCIEKLIVPLYSGNGVIDLPTRIVDILNSNLRYLLQVTGTDTDTSTTHTVAFGNDTFVTTVGVLWTQASVPIALERSDDFITWTTVQEETPEAVAGEWSWYDLDTSVATPYFRVRAVTGTLGFDQIYLGNTPTEIPLARLNRDDYTYLPNKSFQSNRPLQFWFNRSIPYPQMYLWPVPNDQAEVYQLTLWCHRYIMDVGTLTEQVEVPQRWYDALVSGLAAMLALELPDVDPGLIPILDAKAAQSLATAQAEERDNSPIMWAPNISMYTR